MHVVDLFCGAGGFSEGILQAGFHIVFSSDRSAHVKETYENRHRQLGLVQGDNTHFELADIRDLTGEIIFSRINNLNFFRENHLTEIDAIFGGPPCQGFSIAGRRDRDDPRNTLFREYLRIISEVNPKYVVIENVEGLMSMELNDGFESVSGVVYPDRTRVAEVLESELTHFGYHIEQPRILNASHYGVPQRRTRAIFIASRHDVVPARYPEPTTPELDERVTVFEALGDLGTNMEPSAYAESLRNGRTPHFITRTPVANLNRILNNEKSSHSSVISERFSLFREGESAKNLETRIALNGLNLIDYPNLLNECLFVANKESNRETLRVLLENIAPEFLGENEVDQKRFNKLYRVLWKLYLSEEENFTKLANKTAKEFGISAEDLNVILEDCVNSWNTHMTREQMLDFFLNNQAVTSNPLLMEALLTKKNTRSRLDSQGVAPTMLTLPDDFIHPFEDRILTVREMARIQSFDDSFEFIGKRTTGGDRRRDEVPQYTQVGNAVPPLLAFAIATEIRRALEETNALTGSGTEQNQLI
ncbi:DNA cytosine methyltransferase [Planococcus salinarum]|uniref:DNA cytosine methyltransferase n=1 Tax=Planococcus salinarum TaxID=622695 RepID=UPI000E3D9A16|nr:DNA cytosine methyltransferase [Planococcus salinarum]TAA73140.1 DNA cytosine methyltransferase [Planococcus salinarum]